MKYKFIEIGSCDFNTQVNSLLSDNEYGICVDPLKCYLDNLPNQKNLIKENSIISNVNGVSDFFYIEPETIDRYRFPEWFKGCNSVHKPHPTIVNILLKHSIDSSIISVSRINSITYEDLVIKHQANDIDYLKIDIEGHEPVVIDSLCDFYAKDQKDFHPPSLINFEAFVGLLVSKEDIDLSIDKLKSIGYKFSHTIDSDIYMVFS